MLQSLPKLVPPEFFSVGNVCVENGRPELSEKFGRIIGPCEFQGEFAWTNGALALFSRKFVWTNGP